MPRGRHLPRGPASTRAKPKRRLLHMLESFLGMFLHLLHHPCSTAHTKLGLVIVGVSAIALRTAEFGTVVDHSARSPCTVVPRGYGFGFGVERMRAAFDLPIATATVAAHQIAAYGYSGGPPVFNTRFPAAKRARFQCHAHSSLLKIGAAVAFVCDGVLDRR